MPRCYALPISTAGLVGLCLLAADGLALAQPDPDRVDWAGFATPLLSPDRGLEWTGPMRVDEVRVKAPAGVDAHLGRLEWWGSIWPDHGEGGWKRLEWGMGPWKRGARARHLPLIHVHWRTGPLVFHHELAATILPGDYGDDAGRRGDETVVLLTRLWVTNTADRPQPAAVHLRYNLDWPLRLEPDGLIRVEWPPTRPRPSDGAVKTFRYRWPG